MSLPPSDGAEFTVALSAQQQLCLDRLKAFGLVRPLLLMKARYRALAKQPRLSAIPTDNERARGQRDVDRGR